MIYIGNICIFSIEEKKKRSWPERERSCITTTKKKVYLYLIKRYIVGKADIVSPTQKPSLYSAISTKSLNLDAEFGKTEKPPESLSADSGDKEEKIFICLKKLFADLDIDVSSLTERQKVVLQLLAELIVQNF